MILRAVLWDVDGTLVDSEPLHLRALHAACANCGAAPADLPAEGYVGLSPRDEWSAVKDRLPDGLTHARWLRERDTYYLAHAHGLGAMPHALDAVRRLAGAGLAQAAVSNSSRCIVDANLDAVGLGRYLRFTLSLDDVPAGKPNPAPYVMALDRLGLEASRAVAVEDSATGATSAKRAGLHVIGYLHSTDRIEMADKEMHSLKDVADCILSERFDDLPN